MREKVEKVLEEKIKPVLQRDGGDVELIDVNENVLVSEVPGVTQVLGV
ncbi:TPA: NifU family protein [Clostridioides difficile]|nr:NifU family protein [Clostridioides difficile]HBF0205193.1 NifU family protein [Clostridioides difficile]HBF0690770.1 NifU family protein [Clostridioides difficile]HBF0777978.1 NifU family protein [Clostridioides difficile]HBH1797946.1 NifU family protein [Clostridioides difficile]